MDRYPQPSDGHGSLRDSQALVNRFADFFTSKIKEQIIIKSERIDWVSPLKDDDYAEYRDNGFIEKIRIRIKITTITITKCSFSLFNFFGM
jgi:hypothetical protein